MALLTLGDMLKAAIQKWPGLKERASKVSVRVLNTGFRPDWQVPDPEYSNGVQEISFSTLASDSKTDRRHRKPYETVFRFPLNSATGEPFPPNTNASSLPVWVSCSCPSFQYYCEIALKARGNSDHVHSDGSFPVINNPEMSPIICKHVLAASNTAMQKRKTISVNKKITGKDPAEVKGRKTGDTLKRATKRRTPRDPLTASNPGSLPQTWLGRLAYILFKSRSR